MCLLTMSSKCEVRGNYQVRITGTMNSERVAVFKVGADDSDCDEAVDDTREELFVAYTSCLEGLLIHISRVIKWIFSERGLYMNCCSLYCLLYSRYLLNEVHV